MDHKRDKIFRYESGAIEDWLAHDITTGRLFEVLRVNFHIGYHALLNGGFINKDGFSGSVSQIYKCIFPEIDQGTTKIQ